MRKAAQNKIIKLSFFFEKKREVTIKGKIKKDDITRGLKKETKLRLSFLMDSFNQLLAPLSFIVCR